MKNFEKNHTLYYFSTCPFCIKVLLALKVMGIKIPKKNIHSNRMHKAELVKGGGKKQVPCLRIVANDGSIEWMYESNDIIQYLKAKKV